MVRKSGEEKREGCEGANDMSYIGLTVAQMADEEDEEEALQVHLSGTLPAWQLATC